MALKKTTLYSVVLATITDSFDGSVDEDENDRANLKSKSRPKVRLYYSAL